MEFDLSKITGNEPPLETAQDWQARALAAEAESGERGLREDLCRVNAQVDVLLTMVERISSRSTEAEAREAALRAALSSTLDAWWKDIDATVGNDPDDGIDNRSAWEALEGVRNARAALATPSLRAEALLQVLTDARSLYTHLSAEIPHYPEVLAARDALGLSLASFDAPPAADEDTQPRTEPC